MESKERQWAQMKEKWYGRLTQCGSREIDEFAYTKGEKCVEQLALRYQRTMITASADGEGRDIWPDLDLKRNGNHIRDGFSRLKAMAQSFVIPICSKTYQDEAMYQAVTEGLSRMKAYYGQGVEIHGNWWNFDIGSPQALNDVLILLEKQLKETAAGRAVIACYAKGEASYVPVPEEAMRSDGMPPLPMTGANLMDTAMVCLLRGLLSENEDDIRRGAQAARAVLPYVTEGDGFYQDGSFIQHHYIPYAGGYGTDLLRSFENMVYLTEDTVYAVGEAKDFNHVFGWMKDTFLPLLKDGQIMDMVRGRKISRCDDNAHRAGQRILSTLLLLAEYAPEDIRSEARREMKGILERDYVCSQVLLKDMSPFNVKIVKDLMEGNESGSKPCIGHKNYGNMDRVVHHEKRYSAGVSMYSSRIGRFSCGNGENKKGHHTCDGMLYLYTDDVFQFGGGYWPTVDSMRLPGITTDHLCPTIRDWFDNRNTRDWVGGSQVNGRFGSVGMDVELAQPYYPEKSLVKAQPSDLTGKKSWFFFPDQIICLGAGIKCTKSEHVETIVENRKIDGENRLVSPEGEIGLADRTLVKVRQPWLVLEGNQVGERRSQPIGYYFPEKQELSVLRETRTGAWSQINESGPSSAITNTYISIAFEHGPKPENASYSYILLPGKDEADMEAYAKDCKVRILSNTEKLQAVFDGVTGLQGMNFWHAGEISGVRAQNPCSVTMQALHEGRVRIGISDPTHKQEQVVILLDGILELDEKAGAAIAVAYEERKTRIAVDTSKKDGASHEVRFRK